MIYDIYDLWYNQSNQIYVYFTYCLLTYLLTYLLLVYFLEGIATDCVCTPSVFVFLSITVQLLPIKVYTMQYTGIKVGLNSRHRTTPFSIPNSSS